MNHLMESPELPAQQEKRRVLECFANGAATLGATLRRFPRKMWLYKASSDRKSIHESVWHLADSEVVEYVHYRRFTAEPGSPALGIDPSAWCRKLGYFYQDVKEALGIIRVLRQAVYRSLRTLPETAWTQVADVPIYGRLSLDEWLVIRERYMLEHIRQMEEIYSEWLEITSLLKTATSTRKTPPTESRAS
jgi:hypothetical protein